MCVRCMCILSYELLRYLMVRLVVSIEAFFSLIYSIGDSFNSRSSKKNVAIPLFFSACNFLYLVPLAPRNKSFAELPISF